MHVVYWYRLIPITDSVQPLVDFQALDHATVDMSLLFLKAN